jgi:hypothetical protein
MPEIEFHTRRDGSEVAGVHIGGQVVVMSPAEWADVARDILSQVEAHLTPHAPDAATCYLCKHTPAEKEGCWCYCHRQPAAPVM